MSAGGVTPWSIVYAPDPLPNAVPPSPAKCFAVASTPLSCRPSMIVSLRMTSDGSSPKLSYVRPQRSSRATHRHGAKAHGTPVDFVSTAVTIPACSTSAGSCMAPRPMLCGNSVAPSTLLWPWTASTP